MAKCGNLEQEQLKLIRLLFLKSLVGVVHHSDEEVEEDDDVDEGVAAEHEEAEEARELLDAGQLEVL